MVVSQPAKRRQWVEATISPPSKATRPPKGRLEQLIEPHGPGLSKADRHSAQLLAALALSITLAGLCATIIELFTVPNFARDAVFIVSGIAVMPAVYMLARRNRVKLGATLFASLAFGVCLAVGLRTPSNPGWMVMPLLGPLLAALFLSLRGTLIICGVGMAILITVLVARRADLSNAHYTIVPASYSFLAGLTVIAQWHRARLERLRQAEMRERDAALAETRRMEAVGRVAGGVAHDFNNILTVIQANTAMMQRTGQAPAERVAEMTLAAERAASQLLAFTKREVVVLEAVDLNSLIRDISMLLERLTGETIELTLDLAVDIPAVRGDPTQLEQILLNLVANAKDAMPDGGAIVVGTAYAQDTHLVSLRVQDNGQGMDTETASQVFEPFFSTKGEGGTGLGLATVLQIVHGHGGRVRISSEVSMGTVVEVLLPESKRTSQSLDVTSSRALGVAAASARSTGRVLLVEDEELVRNAVAEMLRSLGFEVEAAGSVWEAEVLAKNTGAFDLVVTDQGLPDGKGAELLCRLFECKVARRGVVVSGQADPNDMDLTTMGDKGCFLAKPFGASELYDALHKIGASALAPIQ